MSMLRTPLLVVVAWWVLAAVLAALYSDRLIFQPPSVGYRDGEGILKIRTAAGTRLSAVYLPNPASVFTILYSHGNAEDLGTVVLKARLLRDSGFAVFCYEYEGYGTSEGRPSEGGVYADVEAAYDHLTRELSVPADRIISYGLSLGGAAAADLASRKPVAGLILESTFVSAYRVVTRVPLLPGDKFKTLGKLARIRCPILVMHGGADRVIAQWHGRMLYERANPPKQALWVDGAEHGNLPDAAGERYGKALRDFAALVSGR